MSVKREVPFFLQILKNRKSGDERILAGITFRCSIAVRFMFYSGLFRSDLAGGTGVISIDFSILVPASTSFDTFKFIIMSKHLQQGSYHRTIYHDS